MKRLTKRWGAQPYPNLAGRVVCEYKECDSAKNCNDCVHGHIADRLAAIEDILGDEYDLGELREMIQAKREGRCVVLPCKIGDTVYSIRHERVPDDDYRMSFHIEMRIVSQKFGLIHADCIGKSVFLTRSEAEAALRREQDGQIKS